MRNLRRFWECCNMDNLYYYWLTSMISFYAKICKNHTRRHVSRLWVLHKVNAHSQSHLSVHLHSPETRCWPEEGGFHSSEQRRKSRESEVRRSAVLPAGEELHLTHNKERRTPGKVKSARISWRNHWFTSSPLRFLFQHLSKNLHWRGTGENFGFYY